MEIPTAALKEILHQDIKISYPPRAHLKCLKEKELEQIAYRQSSDDVASNTRQWEREYIPHCCELRCYGRAPVGLLSTPAYPRIASHLNNVRLLALTPTLPLSLPFLPLQPTQVHTQHTRLFSFNFV